MYYNYENNCLIYSKESFSLNKFILQTSILFSVSMRCQSNKVKIENIIPVLFWQKTISYGICSFIFNFLKVQKQSKIKVAKAHFWFVSTERVISCLRKTIHSRITFVSRNLSGPIKICSCIMLLCTSNEIFVSQSENIVKKKKKTFC